MMNILEYKKNDFFIKKIANLLIKHHRQKKSNWHQRALAEFVEVVATIYKMECHNSQTKILWRTQLDPNVLKCIQPENSHAHKSGSKHGNLFN